MTELRTTAPISNSLQLLHTMAIVARQIDPAIELRTETFRKSILICVRFPSKTELERFIAGLSEKNVELSKWAEYELPPRF